MKQVKLSTHELHLIDQGQGAPLLLLHGFPLDHRMWRGQIDLFSRDYRVLAPDLRGFGHSGSPAGDDSSATTTMEQFADDLAELLDVLGVSERVVLCGLSMGGYVAWQFWKKYSLKLRGLVVCDTRAAADSPEALAGRMKMIDHVLRAEGTRYVAEAMLPKMFAPSAQLDQPAAVDLMRQTILAARPAGIAAALRGMAARPDMTDQLPRMEVPTLVIVGEHDTISPVTEMRAIAERIRGAKLAVISGSGHMTPLENPAEFNAALRGFLESLP